MPPRAVKAPGRALLMFNVGVEAGQFVFVAGIVIAIREVARLFLFPVAPARFATAYLSGTISMI